MKLTNVIARRAVSLSNGWITTPDRVGLVMPARHCHCEKRRDEAIRLDSRWITTPGHAGLVMTDAA